ncbi:unnamed protein product [Leptidea sinapis]|uniref:Uncharacterized protein n=1 Tax=Leptidea sinapis TaxID=189913 RepID=A0A5E4PTU8_9NEOP|nr:unnamed protein product [Leptidea sinapis]
MTKERFISTKAGFGKKNKIIKGFSDGGYFGYAIVNLGDMDGDNKDEVAISAPYEDGGDGTVYIFSGESLLNNGNYAQKLKPEKFRGFGLSMTALQDLDNNGCRALAIGAPHGNKVALYKCSSAITVKLSFNLPQIQGFLLENQIISFTICLSVTYPEKPEVINADIEITTELTHPNSELVNGIDGKYSYVENLDKKLPSYCNTLQAKLRRDQNSELFQIMRYKITAKLKNDPEEQTFKPARVVLSQSSKLALQGEEWQSSCNLGACVPLLKPHFISSIPAIYIIGTSNSIQFSIDIENEGQVAYTSCLIIKVEGAHILRHSSRCTRNSDDEDSIKCKPEGAILEKTVWGIGDVELDTSTLTSKSKSILLSYDVYDQCNKESGKKEYTKKIELVPEVNFAIDGHSNPDKFVQTTANELNTEGKKIQHVYTITNNGKTDWDSIKYTIEFNSSIINFNETYIVAQTETSTEVCSVDDRIRNANVTTLQCDISDLMKNQKAIIVIAMDLMKNMFRDEGRDINVYVNTKVSIDYEKKIMKSVSTEISIISTLTPLWIIIVSSLVGFILLLLIAFGLYKCGFLQRKKKENLIQLKKSVHRQSVMRMSMRQSRAARDSTYYDSLLEDEEEYEREQRDLPVEQ